MKDIVFIQPSEMNSGLIFHLVIEALINKAIRYYKDTDSIVIAALYTTGNEFVIGFKLSKTFIDNDYYQLDYEILLDDFDLGPCNKLLKLSVDDINIYTQYWNRQCTVDLYCNTIKSFIDDIKYIMYKCPKLENDVNFIIDIVVKYGASIEDEKLNIHLLQHTVDIIKYRFQCKWEFNRMAI